jgi:predicted Holliday junction resolvase-like endonuclease
MIDREIMEIFTIIEGIVSLAAIIVFFILAENISVIKNNIRLMTRRTDTEKDAVELEIFKGNTQAAVELLHERAFYLSREPKSDEFPYERKKRIKKVAECAERISEIGGTVSSPLIDFLDKNMSEKN